MVSLFAVLVVDDSNLQRLVVLESIGLDVDGVEVLRESLLIGECLSIGLRGNVVLRTSIGRWINWSIGNGSI